MQQREVRIPYLTYHHVKNHKLGLKHRNLALTPPLKTIKPHPFYSTSLSHPLLFVQRVNS